MINLLLTTLITISQPPPIALQGRYVSLDSDLVLDLDGSGYYSNRGRPLFLPQEKRQIEFESGPAEFTGGKLVLKARYVFYSPNRMNAYQLLGHTISRGYLSVYKTEAERKSFLKQLEWREVLGGPKHVVDMK